MAAADETTAKYGTSGVCQSIGRSYGSGFANTLVGSLLHAKLCEEIQTLQPEEPDESQTLTYNAFCHSIWEVCEHRVTCLWSEQGFSFSAMY
ncbi:hypothetical protein N7501_010291 [Penicillium viridicatum]|nr:hypothetical protein N7501_010291 [Penicillium viridicatum]